MQTVGELVRPQRFRSGRHCRANKRFNSPADELKAILLMVQRRNDATVSADDANLLYSFESRKYSL